MVAWYGSGATDDGGLWLRREVSDELRLTAVETMVADKRVNKRGELERCTRAEHEKEMREEKRATEGRDTPLRGGGSVGKE